MAAPVLQLRVPEPTLARIDERRGGDTHSAWVLRLISRELDGQAPAAKSATAVADSAAEIRQPPDGFPSVTLPAGEPSPGVLCMGPGCLERSTARYGLRRMPLCPACRAALEGRTYQREVPESTARAVRRGAG